jgi:hypothetical protein
MALRKLTASGDVRVIPEWARPDVYESWLGHVNRHDYEAIVDALNSEIDRREVVRAQWLVCRPGHGSDWYEVYNPVWEAMGQDAKLAAQLIGLILWEVMFNRREDWYFHKVDKTIANEYDLLEDIEVLEYFRCNTFWARTARGSE